MGSLTAPVIIEAQRLNLNSPELVTRGKKAETQRFVVLAADRMNSTVGSVQTNGIDFAVILANRSDLAYPLTNYASEGSRLPEDPQLKEKYLRLKRILVQFRSHSRGTMARYKRKIENERIAGNDIGKSILDKLLADSVLTLRGQHYFLEPEKVDKHLGISWLNLQKGQTSERLISYLRSIT